MARGGRCGRRAGRQHVQRHFDPGARAPRPAPASGQPEAVRVREQRDRHHGPVHVVLRLGREGEPLQVEAGRPRLDTRLGPPRRLRDGGLRQGERGDDLLRAELHQRRGQDGVRADAAGGAGAVLRPGLRLRAGLRLLLPHRAALLQRRSSGPDVLPGPHVQEGEHQDVVRRRRLERAGELQRPGLQDGPQLRRDVRGGRQPERLRGRVWGQGDGGLLHDRVRHVRRRGVRL
mmetsp:Transcript_20883/g.55978  ORF Transcript_20883/g.55978 Transcript_20883/m.55978 type:complete len:232 (-) Transcript_20883:476-1171(-)